MELVAKRAENRARREIRLGKLCLMSPHYFQC